MITLILIDDDELITMALNTILEAEEDIQILATGRDGSDAVSLYDEHKPDVLLTDIRMKEKDGLSAAEEILKKHPSACVLLLTTFLDDEYIIRAIRAGARGYLLKQDYANLAPAIRAAAAGQSVFGSEITEKLPDLMLRANASAPSMDALTDREKELVALIAEGLSNKEIAEKMFLSEGTVRNYLSTVLEKLDIRDRTKLAVFYLTGKH